MLQVLPRARGGFMHDRGYERGPYTFTPTPGGYLVTKGKKKLGKLSYTSPADTRFSFQAPDGELFNTLKPAAEHLEKLGRRRRKK